MPKITQFFAWVIADKDEDDEGVPGASGPGGYLYPLIGADLERGVLMRPAAQEAANMLGKPIKLVKSTGPLKIVEILEPRK